ncbi:MAG TPA: 50S ribosomal protein L35 [Patescibacteria group bacterium]
MPKLKTNKAVAKKVKVTKKRKVLRRKTNQNHFNSKDSGKVGRSKRMDVTLFKTDAQNVLKSLPYAK